jgi:hypothetical protein
LLGPRVRVSDVAGFGELGRARVSDVALLPDLRPQWLPTAAAG